MFSQKFMVSAFSLGFLTAVAFSSGAPVESGNITANLDPSTATLSDSAGSLNFAFTPEMVSKRAAAVGEGTGSFFPVFIGDDLNSAANTFLQPTDPALSGGGRDQTQQFHDVLVGDPLDISVLIGRLGDDLLVGGPNIDFIIGGPEHFNPNNRDKAFGFAGDDVFIWKPGDGSDTFDGGPGDDAIIFGLIGEEDGSGSPLFSVINNQEAGEVFLDVLGLPIVDVTNSPGFCRVIDSATSAAASDGLFDLGLTHIVQFFIRGINQAFNNGTQSVDNGLRVSVQLSSVEYLVCTDPAGGAIVAFDLRTTPPTPIPVSSLPFAVQFIIQ